jgi:hypothetical protein
MTSQLQGKLACESQPQGKHDHIDQLSAMLTSQPQGNLACESKPKAMHDYIDQITAMEDCGAN